MENPTRPGEGRRKTFWPVRERLGKGPAGPMRASARPISPGGAGCRAGSRKRRRPPAPETRRWRPNMGWLSGLEPPTPRTTIWCSNHLSYSHHEGGRILGAPAGLASPGSPGFCPRQRFWLTGIVLTGRSHGLPSSPPNRESIPRPAPVAQLAEQRILNPWVRGSSPRGSTRSKRDQAPGHAAPS